MASHCPVTYLLTLPRYLVLSSVDIKNLKIPSTYFLSDPVGYALVHPNVVGAGGLGHVTGGHSGATCFRPDLTLFSLSLFLVEFLTNNGDVLGCLDANPNQISTKPHYGNFDIVTDEDGFVGAAGEPHKQYRVLLFSDNWPTEEASTRQHPNPTNPISVTCEVFTLLCEYPLLRSYALFPVYRDDPLLPTEIDLFRSIAP